MTDNYPISVAITVAGEAAFVRKIEVNQIETFSRANTTENI